MNTPTADHDEVVVDHDESTGDCDKDDKDAMDHNECAADYDTVSALWIVTRPQRTALRRAAGTQHGLPAGGLRDLKGVGRGRGHHMQADRFYRGPQPGQGRGGAGGVQWPYRRAAPP